MIVIVVIVDDEISVDIVVRKDIWDEKKRW